MIHLETTRFDAAGRSLLRRKRALSLIVILACTAVVAVNAGGVYAATDPAAACAAAKQKAAAKKASAFVKCYGTALKKGLGIGGVDTACLLKASGKFEDAFQKAEDKGGCATNGDAGTVEAYVDSFVNLLLVILPGVTTTTTTTLPAPLCPTGGDPTACLLGGSECQLCCTNNLFCSNECAEAGVLFNCTDPTQNDQCSDAANAAGCAPYCCP